MKKRFCAAALLSALAFTGCFEDEKGPTAAEVEESRQMSSQGSDSLEALVGEMMQLQSFEYGRKEGKGKVEAAHRGYEAALRRDPGNGEAKLGSALTGILLAVQSPGMGRLLDEVTGGEPLFDQDLAKTAPENRSRVLLKAAALRQLPEFHEVQDTLAAILLPALEKAMRQVEEVHRDPAFFVLVELDGESYELDHAEVGILLASLKASHALLTLFLAYDLDIDENGSYDYLETLETLDGLENFQTLNPDQEAALRHLTRLLGPSSSFLTVRPAYQARLDKVDDGILSALKILRESLASIPRETDSQANDLLRVCAEYPCLNPADHRDFLAGLDTAIRYVNRPYSLTLSTGTVVQVDFSAFLRVQDYKKMLPHYAFFDPKEWSEEKPVFYFTDARGNKTGTLKDLERLGEKAETESWDPSRATAELRKIVKFRDPTFQGVLPGMTEDRLWDLIAENIETEGELSLDEGLEKKAAPKALALKTLSPELLWTLLGAR